MATQVELGKHIDLSGTRVRELIAMNILPAAKKRGQLDLDLSRITYIRHLRSVAAGHLSEDGELDLTAERARVAKEQADKLARENALAEGRVVSSEEMTDAAVAVDMAVRTRLLAIGVRTGHDLAAESDPVRCREIVQGAVRETLEEVAALAQEIPDPDE